MRVAAIEWFASIPNLRIGLFRRTYDDLIKTHMEGRNGFRALLSPWVDKGLVQIVECEIRSLFNNSKIELCHCQHDKDRFNYQSREFDVLLIDELTLFSETVYRFLRSRVRSSGLEVPREYEGMFPRILCGSNPGNVGHLWVKSTFVDPRPPYDIEKMPDEEGGMLRQYIPARLEDNPHLMVDDPGYEAKLGGLGSPELVRAFREGDWNVVAGAFFPEMGEQHKLEPFAIPPHWLRFRAMDWGSAKPFAVGWFAVADGDAVKIHGKDVYLPRGALVMYREWYGCTSPNVGLKLTAEQVADGILMRDSPGEEFSYSVADPSMFATNGGPSLAERFSTRGVWLKPGDNKRVTDTNTGGPMGGWDMLRARFIGEDDKPMIYFFKTCIHALRTIPALQHDETKMEDVDTDGEDHAADMVRYACMSRPWVTESPKVKDVKWLPKMTVNELLAHHSQSLRAERSRY